MLLFVLCTPFRFSKGSDKCISTCSNEVWIALNDGICLVMWVVYLLRAFFIVAALRCLSGTSKPPKSINSCLHGEMMLDASHKCLLCLNYFPHFHRTIYYLDETWVNAGHTKKKVWENTTMAIT